MSSAALDAALDGAQAGSLLFSESMVIRERALVGQAAGADGSGPHWPESTGKQRLLEVMGRMEGDRGLLEQLLLDGVV